MVKILEGDLEQAQGAMNAIDKAIQMNVASKAAHMQRYAKEAKTVTQPKPNDAGAKFQERPVN